MVDASELLAVWEAGCSITNAPQRRAALLHAVVRRDATAEELMSLPIGQRDADLFALRSRLFGEHLAVLLTCSSCAEELEFDIDVASLTGCPSPPQALVEGEWTVDYRLPTPRDLADTRSAAGSDRQRARQLLIGAVIGSARRGDTAMSYTDLPDHIVHALAAKIAAADPNSDIRFNAPCPSCAARLCAQLDIASYLWDEVDAWARQTLLDVHLLASTYGWTEPDILAVPPLRRRHYLELAGYA
jgi:hypothetical protein